MTDSLGTNRFYWQGVVEDRMDPLKLGRVRVRILGIHTEKRSIDDANGEGIPTEALPWAYPENGINSASMNGIGHSPNGVVEGTWVVGYSRDGRACQSLVYTGTIGGIPQNGPENIGFNDPNMKYPKSTHLNEPDTNRLTRNEKIDETIVGAKNSSRDTGITTADGRSWSEPESPYAAEYPFNKVFESESGHVKEIDDTPGAERLHEYHKSGTYEEIHPSGAKVTKVVSDNYEIVIGDDFVHVTGFSNVNIDKALNVNVKGNTLLKCPNVVIESGHIELGKGTDDPIVLGNKFLKWWKDVFLKALNSHNHIGNLGLPTSTPVESFTDINDDFSSSLSNNTWSK